MDQRGEPGPLDTLGIPDARGSGRSPCSQRPAVDPSWARVPAFGRRLTGGSQGPAALKDGPSGLLKTSAAVIFSGPEPSMRLRGSTIGAPSSASDRASGGSRRSSGNPSRKSRLPHSAPSVATARDRMAGCREPPPAILGNDDASPAKDHHDRSGDQQSQRAVSPFLAHHGASRPDRAFEIPGARRSQALPCLRSSRLEIAGYRSAWTPGGGGHGRTSAHRSGPHREGRS